MPPHPDPLGVAPAESEVPDDTGPHISGTNGDEMQVKMTVSHNIEQFALQPLDDSNVPSIVKQCAYIFVDCSEQGASQSALKQAGGSSDGQPCCHGMRLTRRRAGW